MGRFTLLAEKLDAFKTYGVRDKTFIPSIWAGGPGYVEGPALVII